MRYSLLLATLAILLGACGAPPRASQSEEPAAPTSAPSPTPGPSPTISSTTAALIDQPVLLDGAAAPEPSPTSVGPSPTSPPPTDTPQPSPTTEVIAEAPPSPTPQPASPPVRLVIDTIDLDRPLIPVGLDSNQVPIVPRHDAAWYEYSAMPGQGENIVLWGHVLRFKSAPRIPAPFARLKELQPGAQITLYDQEGRAYAYAVTQQVWARPSQVEYILPQGHERVTMVSCIGDKVVTEAGVEMTHRLITIAEPVH